MTESTTPAVKRKALSLDALLPSRGEMTGKILATYSRATEEQMLDGKSWYPTAHHLAVRLDPENPWRAAGVVSALSPQMDWDRNMFLAERTYAEGLAYGCLGASCRKANEIYNGTGQQDDVLAVLGGRKTVAFAIAIMEPDHATNVVVDRHAVSIALGRTSDDSDVATLNRKGGYDWYADAYRAAAEIAGVAPNVMQAVTWTVWRETEIRTAAAVRKAAGR